MAPPVIKAGPITRLCHVCGRQYGLSSFDIHLKQCKKLWVAQVQLTKAPSLQSYDRHTQLIARYSYMKQEELKPKGERRPIPKTPPGLGQMSESEIALSGSGGTGTGNGGGKVDREAIEAMNRAAQESFNVHGMEKCDNCGRTFAEGRLAIHAKSCRPDQAAKKVGDGAAPRNKKEEVDYGRHKTNMSGSAGMNSSSSNAAPPPAKKGQQCPATPSFQDAEPSPPSGSRALSGSIASNRKRVSAQESSSLSSTVDGSQQHHQFQTPLASSSVLELVSPEVLRQELQGKEGMIPVIQGKLNQWEATTLATLQEIRDLKQIFLELKQ